MFDKLTKIQETNNLFIEGFYHDDFVCDINCIEIMRFHFTIYLSDLNTLKNPAVYFGNAEEDFECILFGRLEQDDDLKFYMSFQLSTLCIESNWCNVANFLIENGWQIIEHKTVEGV